MRVAALLLALSPLVGLGCAGDAGPPLAVSPSHAPMFGQVRVTFAGDLASLGDVNYFAVGGIQIYDAVWSPTSVTVTLQGRGEPGPADVVLVGTKGYAIRHGLFHYDAAVPGVPTAWAAFGASLTQGFQSNGIDAHATISGVAAQVARSAGVYLGLPILKSALIPVLRPDDFYLDCTQKPDTGAGLNSVTDTLVDPSTGFFDLRRARVDWTMPPRDFAIGGSRVADVLLGSHQQNSVVEHIVEDPLLDHSDIFAPEQVSQIDRIEKLDPDIGLSTDLIGNDLDSAVLGGDDLHPEQITDLAKVKPQLETMMKRLSRLHGQFFIANIPSLTFVPNVAAVRTKRILAGKDTPESFDAKVKVIDGLTDQYNQALASAMAPYPNLHLVDFKGYVDGQRNGTVVDGELLTQQKFGGLLSFDGLHFSDTGYALYANVFIPEINRVFHTQIPPVDVSAIHAADVYRPSYLRSLGFTCVPPL